MDRPRRYLLIVLLPLLALLPLGGMNALFLDHTGELLTGQEAAAIQQEVPALYGSALHDAVYTYKLALLAARRPDVVVIGSSRVLAMNQSMFAVPFTNLGRTVNYPDEALKLAHDMLAIHRPQVVMFGLDPWWLNPRWIHAPDFRAHENLGGDLSPAALFAPLRWLADGRIDWPLYRDRLTDAEPVTVDGVTLLGLQAMTLHRGYRPDGSLFRGGLLYHAHNADRVFGDTLSRIAGDQAQFRFGDAIDAQRVATLAETVALLQAAGVTVTTYLPPVAPTVREAMSGSGDRFAYLHAARDALATLGAAHLDAWDDATLGQVDCEFFDGFHHGETVDLRILLALAAVPGGLDAGLLRDDLAERLAAAAGSAQDDLVFGIPGQPVRDFLELGCGGNGTAP